MCKYIVASLPCVEILMGIIFQKYFQGGSIVVKALCCKPEGRGFNEYQKHENNNVTVE
jgi:hypothetical protein